VSWWLIEQAGFFTTKAQSNPAKIAWHDFAVG
jgi:hypothetical protein